MRKAPIITFYKLYKPGNMKKDLISAADFLDYHGKHKQADVVDYMIKKYAGIEADPDDLTEIYKYIRDYEPEEYEEIKQVLSGLEKSLFPSLK